MKKLVAAIFAKSAFDNFLALIEDAKNLAAKFFATRIGEILSLIYNRVVRYPPVVDTPGHTLVGIGQKFLGFPKCHTASGHGSGV